jgi:hypothetical protein
VISTLRPLALAALVAGLAACGDNLVPEAPHGDAGEHVDGPPWSLVVLPDTQRYADTYPDIFLAQTRWIAEHAQELRIQYVLHVGDVTERSIEPEWAVARRAFDELTGIVPLAVAPGNHDYDHAKVRTSGLTSAVTVDEVSALPGFVELFEPDRVDNSAHSFVANGQGWLILALEWGPRDEVLEWAGRVLDAHPDDRAIVLTHAYLFSDGNRYDWRRYHTRQDWNPHWYPSRVWPQMNDGEEMWDKLIAPRSNVRLVISGHVANEGVGRLTSKARRGTQVHQLLSDYQAYPMGGAGYLRILTFLPDRLEVSTYSPWLDSSYDDPANQFTLPRP